MELLVKINGEYNQVDLGSDIPLIITSNDPLNFTFGKAWKTYSISVLNTSNNNRIFDNLFHSVTFKQIVFHDTYIVIDSVYIRGILYFTSLNRQEAQAQFIASSGVLWEQAADLNLKHDYTWTEYEHALTHTNVLDNNLFGGDIVYDFIYRGFGLNKSSSMQKLDIAEVQPAIRVKAILEKIFNGYNIEQNVWGASEYEALYLLFSQPFGRNTPNFVRERGVFGENRDDRDAVTTVEQTGTFNTIWIAGFVDPEQIEGNISVIDDKIYRYIVPETGSYRIKAKLSLSLSVDNVVGTSHSFTTHQYVARIRQRDNLLNLERTLWAELTDLGATTYSFFNDERVFELDTKTLRLESGKRIDIEIYYQAVFDGPPITQTATATAKFQDFIKIEPWPYLSHGDTVPGNYAVPDMTVSEFLQGLFRMFNIEFYFSEETKRVILSNRMQATPPVHDLTGQIVGGTYNTQKNPMPDNLLFRYTYDRADEMQLQYEGTGASDGSYFFDNESKETTEVIAPFAFNFLNNQGIIATKRGLTTDEFTTEGVQRIAYLNGTEAFNWTLESANPSMGAGDNIQPIMSAQTVRRNFSNEFSGVSLDYSGGDGIFERLYKDLANRISNQDIVECEIIAGAAFLNPLYFLSGKDLRALYYVGIDGIQGYYQLIELEQVKGNIFRALLFQDNKQT